MEMVPGGLFLMLIWCWTLTAMELPLTGNTLEKTKCVNPYNYSFVLEATPCSQEDELLIVVHTSTKVLYSSRRSIMRGTWLNKKWLSNQLGLKVKIVFFTGISSNEIEQQRLQYESEMYGDIVQSNFEDIYEHNTYKAMSYLLWTSQKCSTAKLLMKIDDDALLKTLKMGDLKKEIFRLINTGKPVYAGKSIDSIPNRDNSSKWYVSKEVWPHDKYPLWFQGLVYFLTPRHTGLLFNTSLYTHYMHTDDVFIGIIVNRTPQVQPFAKVVKFLSEFALEGFDIYKSLRPKWNTGLSKIYHVPNLRLYYSWSVEDLKQVSRGERSWFQCNSFSQSG